MSQIARTDATGTGGMLPELIAWSSSLSLDRALCKEDILGSMAHVTMLAKTGLVPEADARALRSCLASMATAAAKGELELPDGEEDIHMAIEAELARRLGPVAGRLHTARSRNDQVALDLRLHVREQSALTLEGVAAFASHILDRAAQEADTVIPAYTHRQRAQPISVGFQFCAWATALLRAGEVVAFAMDRSNELPLGSGACSGSSLPIDRRFVAQLLGFPRTTINALDTVGDRDFALDWVWAASRVLLALGKMAADLVDFSTSEFRLVRLGGAISAGSSMMPQKRNPDIFELVRGKTARGIGNVSALLSLVKGLPSGYNRDQQEDRQTLLETAPLVQGTLRAMELCLPHVVFDHERGLEVLSSGETQATDLAEALVKRGLPFREAYKLVGALVQRAASSGKRLVDVPLSERLAIHPLLDEASFAVLHPKSAMAAKDSLGGTGPRQVAQQIATLRTMAEELSRRAAQVPRLESLTEAIHLVPLGVSESA